MDKGHFSNPKNSEVEAELGPLAKVWQDFVIRYCKIHADDGLHKDLPWAYNERANVSVLAAAAWKLTNGCALEEYRDRKRDVSTKDKETGRSTEFKGRVDLYVCNQDNIGIAMEAKQIKPAIQIPARKQNFDAAAVNAKSINAIRDAMAKAWKSTKGLRANAADKRYSLTFVTPKFRLANSKSENAIDAAVSGWLRSLEEFLATRPKNKEILAAWVFPPQARMREASVRSGRYRFYRPGVVALFRPQKRARKSTSR